MVSVRIEKIENQCVSVPSISGAVLGLPYVKGDILAASALYGALKHWGTILAYRTKQS